MNTRRRSPLIPFTAFVVTMSVLTACLIIVFGQFRAGSTADYSAVFVDASQLQPGQSVRIGGLRVGTVRDVALQSDDTVVVGFDTDDHVRLSTGTRAEIRYLNLIGDRYLELSEGTPNQRPLARGARIPASQTSPALDLDVLLGGLKPVIQGLDPGEVNALTSALIEIFQGQEGTMESLLSRTSSFSSTLASQNDAIQQLIDKLGVVMKILATEGPRFSDSVDRLQKLVSSLATEREPIGAAIDSLAAGTASLSDLLRQSRPPLADTVNQLNRLAPNLDAQKDRLDTALKKAPENYRKLIRLGSYGSFINYYVCSLAIRVSDLSNHTAEFPVFKQEGGRCAEPK